MTSARSFLAVMTSRLRRSRALQPTTLQRGSGGAHPLAATSEPVVQVWGARARGFKGIFGVHSWIAVKPGGATEYTVYEVIGWRLRRTDTAVVVRTRAPNSWLGAEGALYAETRGRGVVALIQRFDTLAREYPYANTYTLWPGPNSNTFVAWIARAMPELEADLPATAIGKDYRGLVGASITSGGTGLQIETPLVGLKIGATEGLEIHVLALTFGIDWYPFALKVPGGEGRVGWEDR